MAEIREANNQIGLQLITMNVDYLESGNGTTTGTGKLDSETGPVAGNGIYFSRMLGNADVYFQGQYSRNEGRTKYVGGLIGPPSTPYGSVVTTSAAIITNYSVRLGKGIELDRLGRSGNEHLLTPLFELGRQEWFRGVNAGETYYHNTFGAGLLWQYSPQNTRLVVSGLILAGQTFGSYIDVTGYFAGPLGNSSLLKWGISLDYALTKIVHVNMGVDYTSFAYGISDTYGGYLEPDSTSAYLIYRAGLGFSF